MKRHHTLHCTQLTQYCESTSRVQVSVKSFVKTTRTGRTYLAPHFLKPNWQTFVSPTTQPCAGKPTCWEESLRTAWQQCGEAQLLNKASPTTAQSCGEACFLKGSFFFDTGVVPWSVHGETENYNHIRCYEIFACFKYSMIRTNVRNFIHTSLLITVVWNKQSTPTC